MSIQELIDLSILIFFCSAAMYLSLIDLKTMRLPNSIILPLICFIIIASVIIQYLDRDLGWLIVNLGIPALVLSAFLVVNLIYPKGLGMGDVKAIFLIGLVLCRENPTTFFYSVASSFVLGSVFVLLSRLKGKRNPEFPFGPFLLIPAVFFAILQSLII